MGGGGGGGGGGGDKCTTDGKFMPYMSCMPVGSSIILRGSHK